MSVTRGIGRKIKTWNATPLIRKRYQRLLTGVHVNVRTHNMHPGVQRFCSQEGTEHQSYSHKAHVQTGKICCERLPLLASSLHPLTGTVRRRQWVRTTSKTKTCAVTSGLLLHLYADDPCCGFLLLRSYHQVKKGFLLWKLCVYDSVFALWGARAVSTITGGIWTNWRGDLPSFRAWVRFKI